MKQPSIQLTGNTTTTTAEEALYSARPEDSSEHEISLQAQRGLPLILPWGTKPVRLGTTFHSSLLSTADPWSDETPFVLSDLLIIPKELHFEAGTDSTFKKVSTSKQSETEDHLSLKFGVGVGIPFLAEASVEGTYEKHVQENRDVSSSFHCKRRDLTNNFVGRQDFTQRDLPCRYDRTDAPAPPY